VSSSPTPKNPQDADEGVPSPRLHETPHPHAIAPDAAYRRSFLDRRGPDGALVFRALSYGGPILLMFLVLFGELTSKLKLGGMQLILVPVAALVATGLVLSGILRFGQAAGDVVRVATAGANSTPYESKFSREESLVMRGRIDEALRAFEELIASPPTGVDPAEARLRAAELYASSGDVRRAAALLREVQRLPGVKPGQDIYASNRLVDLLLGPLAEPPRALVELRRLIERYPRTTAAAHARTALEKLKS